MTNLSSGTGRFSILKLNLTTVKTFGGNIENIKTAFESMGEILARAFHEFGQPNKSMPPIPEYHGFRPDYDLQCAVQHCNLLPEEH